jgi:uncharacterized protein YidB (DUF937 family)
MGLFDNLVSGAVKAALGELGSGSMPDVLSQVLSKTDLGNVGGLLAMLQQGGLDRQVASWLGNGANMGLSGDQLRSALNTDSLRQLGAASGLPIDQLLDLLASKLPETIDTMSPNGKLEEPAANDGGDLAQQAGLDDIRS